MNHSEFTHALETYENKKAHKLLTEAKVTFDTGDLAEQTALGEKIVSLGPVGLVWVWNRLSKDLSVDPRYEEILKNAHRVLVVDILAALKSAGIG